MLGAVSARHKDKWIDNVVRILSYLGVVTPAFVFAILFVLRLRLLARTGCPTIGRLSEGLPRPPTITGLMTVDSLLAGNLGAFWDAVKHLILPGDRAGDGRHGPGGAHHPLHHGRQPEQGLHRRRARAGHPRARDHGQAFCSSRR